MKLSYSQKLTFFEEHIEKIFASNDNSCVKFISEVSHLKSAQDALRLWPDEIKILIVDQYLGLSEKQNA